MGVTGAIYSYDQQILKWVNTDSYVVQAESTPKLTPAQLYQHFATTQPEIKINSITIAKDPTASSVVNIEKEGERRGCVDNMDFGDNINFHYHLFLA